MFRSFFPNPRIFFVAALIWVAAFMALWFLAGGWLEQYLSLGPWLAVHATKADPNPFFNAGKVWLYEYVIGVGYLFCVPWYLWGDNRRWLNWSAVGSVTIIEVVYFNVQINAWLNDWYGQFFNLIQQALTKPNTVSVDQLFGFLWTVVIVLTVSITILVLNAFLNSHYLFRWRRAMTFYYMANWKSVRHVEGASQRIQEDTRDFVSIVESLGLNFIDSVMTLIVFLPLLWGLSSHLTELPFIGHIDGSLVWVALVSAAIGTAILASAGVRLPGLAFHNQRVEAAFRKELVFGEDHDENAHPPSVRSFFKNMQRNYFRIYFHYTYFNVARYAYLQGAAFIPIIAMAPSIAAAAITFGLFQQINQAFGQVSDSFRFLVNSWTSIINLLSIYKRLRGFEAHIPDGGLFANDYDDPRYQESWDKIAEPASKSTPASFQWALVSEPTGAPGDEDGSITIWYELTDKFKYPGSKTRHTIFPYSKELAAHARDAMEAVRHGREVTARLTFFEQPERVQMVAFGVGGAAGEEEVSHGRQETLESRIRPVGISLDISGGAFA